MSPLWPRSRLRFSSDWYCRLRERRRPGRGHPGQGRWHWVPPTSIPGRSGPLSLVDESCPHPRPLYRPWLALPLRRLPFRLGEAWPSLSNFINARGGGRHTTRAPPPTQAHTRTRDKHPSADANYLPNPREQASQPPGFARQTSAVASGTPSCTNGQPALVTVRRIQGPVSRKEWHVSSAPHARGTPQCSRSEP